MRGKSKPLTAFSRTGNLLFLYNSLPDNELGKIKNYAISGFMQAFYHLNGKKRLRGGG
jgi:hypothetical protein